MRRNPATTVAVILLLVVGVPLTARAQTARAAATLEAGTPSVDEARQRFTRGLELYGERDYAGAQVELSRAYELAPNYKLLYNIGLCYGQQGDAAAAIRHLERYLNEGGSEVSGQRRDVVQKELTNLRARVGYVIVKTNVVGAELLIDDQPLGNVTAEPIMLNAGRRRVWATKAGYYPSSKVVELAASERVDVVLELNEMPKAEKRTDAAPSSRLRELAPFGIVAAVAATLLAVVARSRRRLVNKPPAPVPRLRVYGDAAEGEDLAVEPTPERAVAIVCDPNAAAAETKDDEAFALASAAASDIGRVKPSNQDSYLILEQHKLFVVADGIGGHAGGEIASATAVEILSSVIQSGRVDVGRLTHLPQRAGELASAVYAANAEIRRKAKADWNVADMGTTCVAAHFSESLRYLYVAHIGDSRVYRLRNGTLEQMTTDHTMENLGLIGTRAEHLSRALGPDPCPQIDILLMEPLADDVYLLCSDGLSKMVEHDRIAEALVASRPPKKTVTDLVALANANGGKDNVTALVIRVEARR